MKKCFTQLLPLVIIASTMASCNNTSNPTASSINDTTPSTSIYNEEDIEILDNSDDFAEGKTGGWFDEIEAGRFLGDNSTYEVTFTPSSLVKTYTVTSSNEDVITVNHEDKDGDRITLNTLNPGDTYIEITNSDDMLVLRKTVRVRKAYTEEELHRAVFDNDLYYNRTEFFPFTGTYRVNAIDTNATQQFIITGKDEVDTHVNSVYKFTYFNFYAPFDAYCYRVEVTDKLDPLQQTEICEAYITRTADTIYIYYDPGDGISSLLTWVWPQKYDNIRNF